MTYLHLRSVEQPLTVDTVLRPVMVISDPLTEAAGMAMPTTTGMLSGEAAPLVLAQLEDIDVLRDMGNLWTTFVESGQVWALIIGLVIGYFLRGLTTYS